MPKISSVLSFLGLITVASIANGRQGPIGQIARVLGSVATVTESVGNATTDFIGASSRITSSAAGLVLAVTENGLNITETAWRGIDVVNLTAARCGGTVVVDNAATLRSWLHSHHAQLLLPCLKVDNKALVAAAGESVSLGSQAIDVSAEQLDLQGLFSSHRLVASLRPDGQVMISFDFVSVSFASLWCNPLWEILGYPFDAEKEQILAALSSGVATLPSPQQQWSISAFDAHDSPFQALSAKIQSLARGFLLHALALMNVLGLDSLRGCGFGVTWMLLAYLASDKLRHGLTYSWSWIQNCTVEAKIKMCEVGQWARDRSATVTVYWYATFGGTG